jgi:hypothetical protein
VSHYEPRSFIDEGAYPPIGNEHDNTADQRFSDTDVAEQLGRYTAEVDLLLDDLVIEEEARMLSEDAMGVQEPTCLDLSAAEFPSPIQMPLQTPQLSDPMPEHEHKELATGSGSPPSPRSKHISKPARDVVKQADGRFHCPLED